MSKTSPPSSANAAKQVCSEFTRHAKLKVTETLRKRKGPNSIIYKEQRHQRLELLRRFSLTPAATSPFSSSVKNRRSEREVAEGQGVEDLAPPRFQFLIKLRLWAGCGATVATVGLRKREVRTRL